MSDHDGLDPASRKKALPVAEVRERVLYDEAAFERLGHRRRRERDPAAVARMVFGREFLACWTGKIEATRRPSRTDPVTMRRLAAALAPIAEFAMELRSMIAAEPDGVLSIGDKQISKALAHVRRAQAAVAAYEEYRGSFTSGRPDVDATDPMLPSASDVAIALDSLRQEIEALEPRPRARGWAAFIVGELRGVLVALADNPGRVVDRITQDEAGVLYEFSCAVVERLAPDADPVKIASRVRTAIREPVRGMRKTGA